MINNIDNTNDTSVNIRTFDSIMLTTADNPFNPFTHFDDWQKFDESNGYYTCSYLARIAKTSDELSETDNLIAIEDAINEIIKLNLSSNYKKVVA